MYQPGTLIGKIVVVSRQVRDRQQHGQQHEQGDGGGERGFGTERGGVRAEAGARDGQMHEGVLRGIAMLPLSARRPRMAAKFSAGIGKLP
ncbi:MAG: hypothetical protein LBI48_07175 [Burkholderiaceae bacterium]|jgi:hypothetical protein|nr:hypothetical protein [Burkholderiaceae bacterium]